jgi:ABC-type bacteriocin/lantibiotic exporter with double-glycine peptidase domain
MPVNTTVGIIGQSGAGKSTLVDIVLGLLKPTSGEVLVDGINIEKNIDSWQIKLGYVPQTMYMIDESILKNIALGVPQEKIDYNKITEVIEAADIKYFIQNLPNGLNTNVGEKGVKLSGGQRQRIGIARALYTNPNVLILDEFTSSLDIETEKKIMESINNMKKKITIIIISHRHSVLEGCNKIIRIQNGKLIST